MIADSPYKTGELVMKPFMGILGGLVGAILMIGSIKLMEPLSNTSLPAVLKVFGSYFPFLANLGGKTEMGQITAGVGLLLLGGCVFGIFYALSEQRIPLRGLIADGLFYGFILWILGGLVVGSFLGDEIRSILRSWTFLVPSLLYGVCLAIFAVMTQRNHPTAAVTPRD